MCIATHVPDSNRIALGRENVTFCQPPTRVHVFVAVHTRLFRSPILLVSKSQTVSRCATSAVGSSFATFSEPFTKAYVTGKRLQYSMKEIRHSRSDGPTATQATVHGPGHHLDQKGAARHPQSVREVCAVRGDEERGPMHPPSLRADGRMTRGRLHSNACTWQRRAQPPQQPAEVGEWATLGERSAAAAVAIAARAMRSLSRARSHSRALASLQPAALRRGSRRRHASTTSTLERRRTRPPMWGREDTAT